MTAWTLFHLVVELSLAAALVVFWLRFRHAKDDPRLSRGLQILQSKISVLEDLSDRTEKQAKQLGQLLSAKTKEIHDKAADVDRHLQKLEVSMAKSLEVAKIFQDRIPHQEIIERQATVKFVEAAKLAHQGFTAEEISERLGISKGEAEIIVGTNSEELLLGGENLPPWVETQELRELEAKFEAVQNAPDSNGLIAHTKQDLPPVPLARPSIQPFRFPRLGE